jgi:hypothetical protein
MSTTWKTKYGPRRVRQDPPTLEEAIFAARGLTDDVEAQVEIAAGLMDVEPEQVRVALQKSPAPRKSNATVAFTSRGGAERSVVVERKPTRRTIAPRPLSGSTRTFG